MTDRLRIVVGAASLVVALFSLNVSSPNYTVVLSMAVGTSVLAATLFGVSALKASGHKALFLRGALVLSIVIAGYAGWLVVGTLS